MRGSMYVLFFNLTIKSVWCCLLGGRATKGGYAIALAFD